MNLTQLNEKEKLLVSRLYDLDKSVSQNRKPRYTSFLNEKEQLIASAILPQLENSSAFFGGFYQAQRKTIALFPDYYQMGEGEFPVYAIKLIHLNNKKLAHRDVLGSLIGLGITRESIGDILPQIGFCDFLVTGHVKPVILENLKRIGHLGVKAVEGDFSTLISSQEYESIRGTISSARLDSLVSMLTKLSRNKSAEYIKTEHVQRNYVVESSVFASFMEKDVLTVRGYGKYIVDTIGSPTRKNKLPIECRRYK